MEKFARTQGLSRFISSLHQATMVLRSALRTTCTIRSWEGRARSSWSMAIGVPPILKQTFQRRYVIDRTMDGHTNWRRTTARGSYADAQRNLSQRVTWSGGFRDAW